MGLVIILAALVGLVAALWSGAIWLERAFLIPSPLSLGTFVAAIAFVEIIKRINRRDDPRHSKRPPDAP
jgi:hypothetical protein